MFNDSTEAVNCLSFQEGVDSLLRIAKLLSRAILTKNACEISTLKSSLSTTVVTFAHNKHYKLGKVEDLRI